MSPVCSARRRRLQGLSAAIRMFAVGLGGTAVRAAVSPGERAAVLCRWFQLNDEDHPLSLRSGWCQAEALSLAMVLMIAQGPSASSAISAGGPWWDCGVLGRVLCSTPAPGTKGAFWLHLMLLLRSENKFGRWNESSKWIFPVKCDFYLC